ncbi:DUF2955 domain-containing protein [Alteromonas pelagimontana]|uniref:DUF2955 domain-containing protein n=1 Tax=Alteromonas pelagimontana TaxID=1858656 RepID=A0A6M4MCU2_9ALTE|nr:DUF2955 domain-containing protein [Alteromonas pelagimontana]QJR80668.1 DUF2955 domain-containing protein [Alteromonas pelagimontana]
MSTDFTVQEQRRLLRIAFGACIGFTISKVMNWPYGVFFTVYPMLLLGMLPKFDSLVAFQFLGSVTITGVEIYLLNIFFSESPLLMTMGVFAVFAVHFRFMAVSSHFMMWASGLISLSVLLHFSSYPGTSLSDMMMATFLATLISVCSAACLYWIIPEKEPVPMPPKQQLSAPQINHRMLMGACLATISFVVFQIFDLKDSLSAQVATVLVLFPMTYQGTLTSAFKRAKGVALGCALGITVQIMMYDLIQYLPLVVLVMFMTVMFAAKLHLIERSGSGMGFGALTTLGILFGQYLQPNADMFYSGLYRLSSVVGALCVLMIVAYYLDGFLNKFAATQNT